MTVRLDGKGEMPPAFERTLGEALEAKYVERHGAQEGVHRFVLVVAEMAERS